MWRTWLPVQSSTEDSWTHKRSFSFPISATLIPPVHEREHNTAAKPLQYWTEYIPTEHGTQTQVETNDLYCLPFISRQLCLTEHGIFLKPVDCELRKKINEKATKYLGLKPFKSTTSRGKRVGHVIMKMRGWTSYWRIARMVNPSMAGKKLP